MLPRLTGPVSKPHLATLTLLFLTAFLPASAEAQTVVFTEDFESGFGTWMVDNGIWQIGSSPSGPPGGVAFEGTGCAGTVLAGNYPANTDSSLISPIIVLPTLANDSRIFLRAWQWFNYGSGDQGQVRISVFDPMSAQWSSFEVIRNGPFINSSVWSPFAVDLSAYEGETIRLAFSHFADGGGGPQGWYLDDLEIRVTDSPLSAMEFATSFENGWEDWWVSNGVWQNSSALTGPPGGVALDGSAAMGTVAQGNYPANTDSRLVSPAVELPPLPNPDESLHLRFWEWFNYGSGDSGRVDVAVFDAMNGTWGSWQTVRFGPSITSSVWSPRMVDVSPFAGEIVRFSFAHFADGGGGPQGWFVDDLELRIVSTLSALDFATGFENGWEDWWVGNGVWQLGSTLSGPPSGDPFAGSNAMGTVAQGNYPANTDTRIVSPPVILPTVGGTDRLDLRFWEWFNYGSGDSGRVDVSVLDPMTGTWGAWETLRNGPTITSSIWAPRAVDLTAYSGETVRISFAHFADGGGGPQGWFIDELELRVVPTLTAQDVETGFENGFEDWWVGNGIWQLSSTLSGPPGGTAFEGTTAIGTVVQGSYPANTDTRIVSPPFVLPTLGGAQDRLHLRFWEWFSYGSGDSGRVDIAVLDPMTGSWGNWETVRSGPFITSSIWAPRAVNLSAYAGETVRISFAHFADGGGGPQGWFVDDLEFRIVHPLTLSEFATGFENGWEDWWVNNGVWQRGSILSGPPGGSSFEGSSAMGTVAGGVYPANTDSRLISPAVVLPTLASPDEEMHLRFWEWFNYGSGDSGRVDVSVLDPMTGSWGPWETIRNGPFISSSVWSPCAAELTAYAGETVRISFAHFADGGGGPQGWFVDDLEIRVGAPVFTTGFESGWGDWSASNGIWGIGTTLSGPPGGDPYEGQASMGTVPSGNYPANSDSRLISPSLRLPLVTPPEQLTIQVWHWFNYGSGDSGLVQVSVQDPLDGTWSVFTSVSSAIVSSSPVWSPLTIDLTPYAGEKVRIGFLHSADGGGGPTGWYLDSLQVTGPEFLRGDVNGDDSVDIADAIGILAVLFQGQPNSCWDAMDTNDSGQATIADAIYLVSYLFTSGPAPHAPFPNCGADPTADSLGCFVFDCP